MRSVFVFSAIVLILAFASLSFASITPREFPVSPPYGCSLSPSSIDSETNTNVAVSPSCFVDSEQVPCPGLSWSATVGTISGGPFSITYNSGSTAASGTLTASGSGFTCSIPITVRQSEQPPAPPGNITPVPSPSASTSSSGSSSSSGSASGGGSFRTSTTISTTCAGKEAKVKVTYFVQSAPAAVVDVFYTGEGGFKNVFSQRISSTGELSFTPQKAGGYELHVSLGADQTTASFSVPECTLGTPQAPQEITVNLQPEKELLFSKTVDYENGFAKQFSVYKITSAGSESFSTEVVLQYTNSGTESRDGFVIYDAVPASILSSSSQISFATSPANMGASGGNPAFSWNVASLPAGQTIKYSYSFQRLLTENMVGRFASPSARAKSQSLPLIGSQDDAGGAAGSGLFASLFTFEGVAVPLAAILAGIGVIVLALLGYLFVFGKKREE